MTETNISIARVPQVTVIDPRIPEKAKLRVAAYAESAVTPKTRSTPISPR